jgi:hypothetical protein
MTTDAWLVLAATGISAVAAVVVATFTIVLATVGRQQIADARILQRAYVSVEPKGIEWTNNRELVGQVVFKNVGKLPATNFVSVVKKIEVKNNQWVTPDLTDNDLPSGVTGVVPIGAEAPQGSGGITLQEVDDAQVVDDKYLDKYLYVWGRVSFMDGFTNKRYVNFCHRYPLVRKVSEPTGPGYSILPKFARYHQFGNRSN